MTEQELRQQLIKAAYEWSISSGDESIPDVVMPICKAYADRETKELEEAYAELKSSYEKFYESDAVQHKQILALNAEIKRLKDGIASVMDRFNFPTEARDRLNGLLSPAPVTETLNEDQV